MDWVSGCFPPAGQTVESTVTGADILELHRQMEELLGRYLAGGLFGVTAAEDFSVRIP